MPAPRVKRGFRQNNKGEKSMTVCRCLLRSVLGLLLGVIALHVTPAEAAFDFDNGNAAIEVVIPSVVPIIFQSVNPGDASLILRYTTLITNSWFDAIAPYHQTAVGVNSRLGRRPPPERTNRNKNIAILYASYRVLNSLFPQSTMNWRTMLTGVGLNPDDNSTNKQTPVGIGNSAGNAVVAFREHDGMNQLGDEGGRQFNREPYRDYTGYKPVNTAYEILDPSRWQPSFMTRGTGIFTIQQFVTPQWRQTVPYSYSNPDVFVAPIPTKSNVNNLNAYKQQADQVLNVSANLTDAQKMSAELFNNKITSLGFSALFVSQSRNFTIDQFVHYDFLTNLAAFDGGIATWDNKYRYDAVRPFTAVHYLYGNSGVTAWGGPGKGTVNMPGREWTSYLGVADHPEYPSGSACFCSAHAQASRRFLGSDNFGWSVPFPRGSSVIEPGVTPATDIVIPFPTFTEFENICGQSRLYGGVHFPDAITAGHNLCRPIGDLAYEFVTKHISGNVN
jgi:hypothetical protein